MRKFFRTTAVLAFMICLSGLLLSGTAFAGSCIDNGDGTVTDNYYGLMWQQAKAGPMNWHAAKDYASNLSLGGYSDWRLPRNEFNALYMSPCKDIMEMTWNRGYWTSSTSSKDTNKARVIIFSSSFLQNDRNKSLEYYVRAVRNAQ